MTVRAPLLHGQSHEAILRHDLSSVQSMDRAALGDVELVHLHGAFSRLGLSGPSLHHPDHLHGLTYRCFVPGPVLGPVEVAHDEQ